MIGSPMKPVTRRLLLVIGLIVVGSLGALGGAPSARGAELAVGGKVGLALSRLDIDGWGGSSWHEGVAMGAFATVGLNRALSVQPGVNYVRRGGRYTDRPSLPGGSLQYVAEASYAVSYLEVPVLLRYRALPGPRSALVVIAGPVWRAALSSEMTFDGAESEGWADGSGLAFAVGLGLESTIGRLLGSVEAVYSRSFGGVGDGEDHAFGAALEGVGAQLGIAF
jgi:hypothetical protein